MINNNIISKGPSDVGGNSPIGTGIIETVAGIIAFGQFSWTVTVPANQRWLLIGMKTDYSSGTITTNARRLNIILPGGNITIDFYPNINENWIIQCGVGIENRVTPDTGPNPANGAMSWGIPHDTWLNAGDVIGMSGITFDVDTIWQFNEVRVIRYNV